ncbi:MAG: SCO family protein [Niastella sp.]|nr:SCO family protein [Niastella sp.]
MKKIITGILFSALIVSCSQNSGSSAKEVKAAIPGATELKQPIPQESIFQLKDSFETQDDKPFTLAMLQGKPTVVGMIFTHCTYACPRLTADIQHIAKSLKEDRDKVNFVLVSFDAARDTAARLKEFAENMHLDKNWILLHGDEDAVRTLSVLLGVQFEKDANGDFSHSNLVSLLDKQGVFQYQKEGLEADHAETINRLKKLMAQN